MARRRRSLSPLNAWPGYVDALSSLLMVVTFVLLVFILGQQFLSAAINQKEHTLDSLRKEMQHLAQMLSLSEGQVKALQVTDQQQRASIANLTTQLDDTQKQLSNEQQQLVAKEHELTTVQEHATATETAQQNNIAALTAQVTELTQQLQAIAKSLEIEKTNESQKDAQIADLGKKLNIALADKINQLKQYRSDFFARLRDILKGQPGVEVVGDRFVFQSEILFPTGSASLSAKGQQQIDTLAHTLSEVIKSIPADLPWILRVDGHADSNPIHTSFASNWELSSARAITVVKTLIAAGISPRHLAATGFSDNQPLDSAQTAQAFARNRRIEFRLTDR